MPNRSLLATLLLPAFLFPAIAIPQEKGDITLQVVKYDGLKQAVLQNRGKVVLVDFWDTL